MENYKPQTNEGKFICINENIIEKTILRYNRETCTFRFLAHYSMSICDKCLFLSKSKLQIQIAVKLLKCFNTNQTWHKCLLDNSLCNSMLNLKFLDIMTTREHLKIAKTHHYFTLIFSLFKLISKCCNFRYKC
jgi:hypothetical protein